MIAEMSLRCSSEMQTATSPSGLKVSSKLSGHALFKKVSGFKIISTHLFASPEPHYAKCATAG